MDYIFSFKGRKYNYNSETKQVQRITESGGKVPVAINHPSLVGLDEYIKEEVVTTR